MLAALGIDDFALFVGAGLLLNLTPGADLALIASRSTAQGFRQGAAAALGVGAGCLLHTLGGALGLSALLAGSEAAFTALRWIGAAYLVWLAWGLLRTPAGADGEAGVTSEAMSLKRAFAQGFLTNALNPKVALFFLAFVPQFIAADSAHKAWAFVVLGLVFNLNGTLVNLGLAWAVSAARRRFDSRGRAARWLTRLTGAVFVALALRLAWGMER